MTVFTIVIVVLLSIVIVTVVLSPSTTLGAEAETAHMASHVLVLLLGLVLVRVWLAV